MIPSPKNPRFANCSSLVSFGFVRNVIVLRRGLVYNNLQEKEDGILLRGTWWLAELARQNSQHQEVGGLENRNCAVSGFFAAANMMLDEGSKFLYGNAE